ncbi:unnamed protein product [Bursaphelenchus okinawaensis]|uniref:Uncharacterized protein n=1 Tax=Bursaphelenchus okinawaensis TaxID=465554 RepID=A0A811L704_9BILA|nr:unnamed protein product [Bursaphelenchus okinawaensis]CAG9119378.1 unnamed protein product [Bursaphelenchus okinawaensis]
MTVILLGICRKTERPSKNFLRKVERRGQKEDAKRRERMEEEVKEKDYMHQPVDEFMSEGAVTPDVQTLIMEPSGEQADQSGNGDEMDSFMTGQSANN